LKLSRAVSSHADLGHGAGDQHRLDVPRLQEIVEVRVVEGAIAELVDDRIARLRIDLVDDVRAVQLPVDVLVIPAEALPAAAHRGVHLRRPLPDGRPLGPGQELGVDDGDAARAAGGQQRLVRGDRRSRLGHFERRAHPHEIVLHVHDHQRRSTEPIELHRWPPRTLHPALL
jgi:hypothetical protein